MMIIDKQRSPNTAVGNCRECSKETGELYFFLFVYQRVGLLKYVMDITVGIKFAFPAGCSKEKVLMDLHVMLH